MALIVSRTIVDRPEYVKRFEFPGRTVILVESDRLYRNWAAGGCLFVDLANINGIVVAQADLATTSSGRSLLLHNFRRVNAAGQQCALIILSGTRPSNSSWRMISLSQVLIEPDLLFGELAIVA